MQFKTLLKEQVFDSNQGSKENVNHPQLYYKKSPK